MIQTYENVSEIVMSVASELGIDIVSGNVMTSSDKDAKQLARFLVGTCEEALQLYPWRAYLGNDPWVKTASGEFKHKLDNDTDVPLIDSRVLKLGTRWRYLHSKGLTYAEDFRSFQLRINSFAYDKNRGRTVDMNTEVKI